MSSSNRPAEPPGAVVTESGRSAGAVRLPDDDPAAFIEQFNRTYGALGMTIRPLPNEAQPAEQPSRL